MKSTYVLFAFFALTLLGCTAEDHHNFGVDQDSLCSGVSTGVTVRCTDALTGTPLSHQCFTIKENEIVWSWGGPLTELVDTLRTDSTGAATVRFTHSNRPNFEYKLLHVNQGGWYSSAQYRIPEGCDNSYNIRLKKTVPIELEVRNESTRDLGDVNLSIYTLPSHANLGGTYRPVSVILEAGRSLGLLSAGTSKMVSIQVLPAERTVISCANTGDGFVQQRDTFLAALTPQGHVLRFR